jgi:hypothetical protein
VFYLAYATRDPPPHRPTLYSLQFVLMSAICSCVLFLPRDRPTALLDLDIDGAFKEWLVQFNEFVYTAMKERFPEVGKPELSLSVSYFRASLAAAGGLIGSLMLLPSLRAAKSYQQMTAGVLAQRDRARPDYSAWSKAGLTRCGAHISFFMPLLLSLLWVPALTKDAVDPAM